MKDEIRMEQIIRRLRRNLKPTSYDLSVPINMAVRVWNDNIKPYLIADAMMSDFHRAMLNAVDNNHVKQIKREVPKEIINRTLLTGEKAPCIIGPKEPMNMVNGQIELLREYKTYLNIIDRLEQLVLLNIETSIPINDRTENETAIINSFSELNKYRFLAVKESIQTRYDIALDELETINEHFKILRAKRSR